MDENQQAAQSQVAMTPSEVEALIALVEERVIESLTRAIERIVQERSGSSA